MPALLLVTFATVFSISTLVVGPALTDSDEPPAPAVQPSEGDAARRVADQGRWAACRRGRRRT